MIRRPPRSTRTDTLFPDTTLFRSVAHWLALLADGLGRTPHGSPAVPLLFARAAGWLDDEDWQVRAVVADALVRNGQGADALVLLGADEQALPPVLVMRSEEHTSELQSLMRISYAVFCLKKKKHATANHTNDKTPLYSHQHI